MKKIIAIMIPILLLGSYFVLKGNNKPDTVSSANVVVEERRIESNIFLNGTVVTEEVKEIESETNDVIEAIKVKIGDQVVKGDILVVQNSEALETSLSSLKLQLEIENILLEKLKSNGDTHLLNNLTTAKLTYQDSKAKMDKDKKLLDAGIISQQQYDASVLTSESSKNQYQNAQYSFSNSSRETDLLLQIKSIETLENDLYTLEKKIANATIKATINGTVTDIVGIVGERATGRILTIANFDKNIISTQISEADINKISVGQPVIVTANSIKNENFSGKVTWISPDSKKMDGKKQAYVEIKVVLDEIESKLRRNFSVNLKIQTADQDKAKAIKFEGIKTKPSGESYVTILNEDGTTEEVMIKTGIEGEVYVEVISDQISIGDKIIIDALPEGYGEDQSGIF